MTTMYKRYYQIRFHFVVLQFTMSKENVLNAQMVKLTFIVAQGNTERCTWACERVFR